MRKACRLTPRLLKSEMTIIERVEEAVMRQAEIERNTFETKIKLSLNLDAQDPVDIQTGVGFFDHMLTLFARHARMSLVVKADGDLWVDSHHTVEDVGIVLGQALKEALGDKAGINRYGTAFVPMDETCLLYTSPSPRDA